MNRFVSPLRYPGGKLKVVNYIKRLMEENDLCGGTYIEPYAGGANVALSLLLSKYAKRIKINDIAHGNRESVSNDTGYRRDDGNMGATT